MDRRSLLKAAPAVSISTLLAQRTEAGEAVSEPSNVFLPLTAEAVYALRLKRDAEVADARHNSEAIVAGSYLAGLETADLLACDRLERNLNLCQKHPTRWLELKQSDTGDWLVSGWGREDIPQFVEGLSIAPELAPLLTRAAVPAAFRWPKERYAALEAAIREVIERAKATT